MHVGVNLLFLAPGEMGGLEVYSRELVGALVRRDDVELTLFVNRLAGAEWSSLAPVAEAPVDPRRRAQWVAGDQLHVPRLARQSRVELVHSLASTGPAAGGFARVLTVHDLHYRVHPEAHFGVRGLGMRALVPVAVRRADRVIVPSEATRADLLRHTSATAGRVDVVPEGIGQAPSGKGDAAAVRERLGAGERPIALSVSAKRPHKNLSRLLDALASLPAGERPVLVLGGYATAHEEDLRAQAERLGLGDDVRFQGWIDPAELEGLYDAAAFMVFPSLAEGFGLPVLEAMRRGVPVACSDIPTLREVAGDAALLVNPLSVEQIAGALRRLTEGGEEARRLSEAGPRRAAQFSWERSARLHLDAYRRLMSGAPGYGVEEVAASRA